MGKSYLQWVAGDTPTDWWHDSADSKEVQAGLDHGAVGVTINPVLVYKAVCSDPEHWKAVTRSLPGDMGPGERTEEVTRQVVVKAASMLQEQYERGNGRSGYVCAQVDPSKPGDRDTMIEMARRFHAWAPNIAVKLPVTAAGLDVLEDCIAEGMTITATVSFTVPQLLAIAERHRKGVERARGAGVKPGSCFAVLMIGRIDDYLQDVARDRRSEASEADIGQAGLAIAKRAYSLYREKGYEAVLLVAALRGTYHMTGLAGGELTMSIHPKYQQVLLGSGVPREDGIQAPVGTDVIKRLETIPDFVRAYEPDGLAPEEFITYGVTQRTLSQFSEKGWSALQDLLAGPAWNSGE